jgi:acetyl esterase/lipase
MRLKKSAKKLFRPRRALVIIVMILAGLVCFANVSPYPAIWFTRVLFTIFPYSMAEDYARYKGNVEIINDIDYQSEYPNGFLDIIRPKNANGSETIIFFVHGGGYIYGTKKQVEHYFVHLANEGFVTVNIDYALAPEHARYPIPVKQLEEAYTFIKQHAADYRLNLDAVYFGGDSAGGHIAAQFVTMQTNSAYRSLVNSSTPVQFENVIDRNTLRGILFLCAVYDIVEMADPPPNSITLPLRKIGLAYFGTSDLNSKVVTIAGIIDKVNKDFPRTFITDGNRYSIEWEAKKFETVLKSLGVETEAVFYDINTVKLEHEYQFNMNNPYAQQTFNKLVAFLRG